MEDPQEWCAKLRYGSKNQDMISTLPPDVIMSIFKYLPIEDVAKTSILSKDWMEKWVHCQHLLFDSQSLTTLSRNHTDAALSRIVIQVLLQHENPILSFVVDKFIQSPLDFDLWILALSKKSLTKLVLNFSVGYAQIDCFRWKNLTYLQLCHCNLQPPLSFKSLCRLTDIHLHEVILTDKMITLLAGSSPILQNFSLIGCRGYRNVDISAPTLQNLHFSGNFSEFLSLDATNIVNVTLNHNLVPSASALGHTTNFQGIRLSLEKVEKLVLEGYFLTKWVKMESFTPIPKLPQLKKIYLKLNIANFKDVLFAIALIVRSPNLEEITIYAYKGDSWIYTNNGDVCNLLRRYFKISRISLPHVKRVSMINFMGLRFEVLIVRALLFSTPSLETFSIEMSMDIANVDRKKLCNRLNAIKRASLEVVVRLV